MSKLSKEVISYMQDNDSTRPDLLMDLLKKMSAKQLLDIIKINADNAGLDVKKILIQVIVKMAKDADKQGTDNSPTT